MTTSTPTLPLRPHQPRSLRQIVLCTACGLCGFLTVFGLAHLALIHITKPSGYVFFGTLALVPALITLVLTQLISPSRRGWQRFGFGAVMCLLAVPCVYLARFFPLETQASVRNLLGLPFFVLALVGPEFLRRGTRRGRTAEA